ncbi:MAG: hypothetical protein U0640_09025 [Phycisphaerales bacterium]
MHLGVRLFQNGTGLFKDWQRVCVQAEIDKQISKIVECVTISGQKLCYPSGVMLCLRKFSQSPAHARKRGCDRGVIVAAPRPRRLTDKQRLGLFISAAGYKFVDDVEVG